VVFVQLVNSISGHFVTGNEHLQNGLLKPNGGWRVDAYADRSRQPNEKDLPIFELFQRGD